MATQMKHSLGAPGCPPAVRGSVGKQPSSPWAAGHALPHPAPRTDQPTDRGELVLILLVAVQQHSMSSFSHN